MNHVLTCRQGAVMAHVYFDKANGEPKDLDGEICHIHSRSHSIPRHEETQCRADGDCTSEPRTSLGGLL